MQISVWISKNFIVEKLSHAKKAKVHIINAYYFNKQKLIEINETFAPFYPKQFCVIREIPLRYSVMEFNCSSVIYFYFFWKKNLKKANANEEIRSKKYLILLLMMSFLKCKKNVVICSHQVIWKNIKLCMTKLFQRYR